MHNKKTIEHIFFRPICWLFLILFLGTGVAGFSQETKADSVEVKKPLLERSPRKATIYSAIIPGLGQFYNHKYWKVPLIYGGFVTFGYFINFNNNLYIKYRRAYSDIIDDDPSTNSYKELNVNPIYFESAYISQLETRLKSAKNTCRRNRDLVIICTAAFYALNIMDASVDAHFFNFDIGEDLSFNWAPSMMICADQKVIGLQCKFNF
jgi:hypothetical protein